MPVTAHVATEYGTLQRVANTGALTSAFTASYAWYKGAGGSPALKIGFVSSDPMPAPTRIGDPGCK